MSSTVRRPTAVMLAVAVTSLVASRPATAGDQPTIGWITQFATDANDEAVGVAVEGAGIFVTGYTSAAFPGQVRHPRPDAFVQRYDETGTVVWTDQFGSDVYDYAYAIASSPSGVYVAGGSNGALEDSVDPQEFDVFVRAYDLDGNVMWTSQFGGRRDDYAYGVDVDDTGIYVVGYTRGRLPRARSRGRTDAFVAKLRLDGRVAWTRQFGTAARDEARAVSIGASGIFVAGFVGGPLPGERAQGGTDAFVTQYGRTGREIWMDQFGTTSSDDAFGITVGPRAALVVGSTRGRLSGRSLGGSDGFARKYRLDGRPGWTRVFGTAGQDVALAASVVGGGTLFIAGWTDGSFPDETNAGGLDAFVRTYAASGATQSTLQLGSSSDDEATAVAASETDSYLAGVTEGALPGATRVGREDAFLAQILT